MPIPNPLRSPVPEWEHRPSADASSAWGGLLNTRFSELASNTIDYWMLPDTDDVSESTLLEAIESAPVSDDSTVQIYIHVPFCAQRCRFCAFSGGNSLDFKQAERFTGHLITQLHDLLERTPVAKRRIRSVNIGGGSPDLLGPSVGKILTAVRNLSGCDDDTEIAVEFTLSTLKKDFVDELVRHKVMKASFGVQTFDPAIRRHLRQPPSVVNFDQALEWLGGRIPIVNADLITGLPGQELGTALDDLHRLMQDPRITAVSSYVLTSGAAPSLLAALGSEKIPPLAPPKDHAQMRLLTYSTLAKEGWRRRGTNTFYDPTVGRDLLHRLVGNECIGTQRYEDYLIGVGPQAVSSLPGVRIENRVDIEGWNQTVENGHCPWHLPKCATVHQRDTLLWAFPLRWEGLPKEPLEKGFRKGHFTPEQIETLHRYVQEGFIVETEDKFALSILGEVFMGHLVRGLKNREGRLAIDEYIREGQALGTAIAQGKVADRNAANNRQSVSDLLLEDRP